MGGTETKSLCCHTCNQTIEKWEELPCDKKDSKTKTKKAKGPEAVKGQNEAILCAECHTKQLDRKDPVRGKDELEQELREALEAARELCVADRQMEEERWQSSEVTREVFHEEGGSNPGDEAGRESTPCPADETDAPHQQALCKAFKRLLSQDRLPRADALSQAQDRIIAKLSQTAAGRPVGMPDLKPIVHDVSYTVGTNTTRQCLFTEALTDTWYSLLKVKTLSDLVCFSPTLLAWRRQGLRMISDDSNAKLKFLELLLHSLDKLRERETDDTWVEVQRECLRCFLEEMGLDISVASPLLVLTGRGHWSGQQALGLLYTLSLIQPDPCHTVELLELLQRHHILPTWTNPQGLSVMDMIQQESDLKELHQRLEKQLDSREEDQLKLLEQSTVSLDKTSKAEVLVNTMYQKVNGDNFTNPWTWLDQSIVGSLLLVLLYKNLEYAGPVGLWVMSGIFCYLMVNVLSTRKDWRQREDHAEQKKVLKLLTDLYRAFSCSKGWSPTYHQMLTLCELTTSPERKRPWTYVTAVQDSSCIASMLTVLQVMQSKVVGVLMDSPSHRLEEWEEFYRNLNIKSFYIDTVTTQISPTDKMVLFGDLEGFINNFLQLQPWVEKVEERGAVFKPQSLVLGGHLPENTIEFGHLGEDNIHIQSTLTTLVKAASTSMKHQTEMISILLFALNTLSDTKGTDSKTNTPKDKLAAICKQFSTQPISKKDFNLVRLLEIVLRCIHCQRQDVEKERETPFTHTLEMLCFEHMLSSASRTCQMELFQHSLKVLSTLVRLKLWDGVGVLDLFHLLVKQLGKTGNFRVKILTAIGRQKQLKQQMIDSSPLTLSSTLKVLQLMEVNLVPSSFKDAEGSSLAEQLLSNEDGPGLFAQLKASLQMDREKSLDDILRELQKASDFEGIEKVCETIKYIVDHVVKEIRNHSERDTPVTGESKHPDHLKCILLHLCRSVKSVSPITPRLTQMVSWCLLVLSDSGRLLQLGTGEGKSCVVAMFAAYKAKWAENKVDILSSSPVLAKRDSDEWHLFYNDLKITVDCNTDKNNDEARKKCYEAQVVYGTVESFAADCLRQDFEKKDVRPDRQFQCIIVDEVDSLLLDYGVQTSYLSSDMPGMEHLNIILATIWSMVCKYRFITNSDRPTFQGPSLRFYKVLYDNTDLDDALLQELLKKAETETVLPPGFCDSPDSMTDKCEDFTQDSLIKFFSVATDFLSGTLSYYTQDSNGQLKLCEGSDVDKPSFLLLDKGHCSALYDDVDMLCQTVEQAVRSNLHFTNPSQNAEYDTSHGGTIVSPKKAILQDVMKDAMEKVKGKFPFSELLTKESTEPNATGNRCIDTRTHIPGFLKDLVNQKLGLWVRNAFQALQMQEKEKYIVSPDGICPVDSEHTGVVERNKKWGDGLQQFLEMKHWTKLSSMTVITNFLSNVSFFKKYQGKIFGITGTLGNQCEMNSLNELYDGLSTVKIPTFLNSKLFEEEGEMLGDEDQWTEKICVVVLQQTRKTRYRDGRAALVICETIKQAQNIHTALDKRKQQRPSEIRTLKIYTDDSEDNTNITGQELQPGDVIVATNLAGRGTDLQVSKKVLSAGGLFVVLTFLPGNDRVEQQAFGRTARQGKPGSAQLLACSTHLPRRVYDRLQTSPSPGPLQLLDARRTRDHVSAERVSQVLKNDIPRILQREELFSEYCRIIQEEVYNKTKDKAEQKVEVAILNEYWGLWYLRMSEEIKKNNPEQLKEKLRTDMKKTYGQLQKRNPQCSSIYHYIKIGNKMLFKKDYKHSKELYTKAIELDSDWAAIAYYYRAYVKHKTDNQLGQTEGVIEDLNKACESVDLFISQCQTIFFLLSDRGSEESQPDISVGLELPGVDRQTENSEKGAEEEAKEEQKQEKVGTTRCTRGAVNSLQEQITAKLQMWLFFRQNIEAVIRANSKKMELYTVFSLMKSPSPVDQREMFWLHQMGLERVFGTRDMVCFCWKGLVVIFLGVVELIGGLILGDVEMGIVASLGLGVSENSLGVLGKQGLRDIMTGIRVMKTGELNWNTWMRDKTASFINNFVVFEAVQNEVRKVLQLPKERKVGTLEKLQNTASFLKSMMNKNLEVPLRCTVDDVSKLIGEYGLKNEEQIDLKEICDSVSKSIQENSLCIMERSIESEPLSNLIRDMVRHYEPMEDNSVTSCYSVLPEYNAYLIDVFMELVTRALESQITGRKQPKMLLELMGSVGHRVVEQLRGEEGKGITAIMKQEYEGAFQCNAPDALMATADDFIKDLCRLLTDHRRAQGTRRGRRAPSEEQLRYFRGNLVKLAAGELSKALWEMLLQFLGRQQVDLFSSRFRRGLEEASRSYTKTSRWSRAGQKTPTNARRAPMQRQSTVKVIKRLEDSAE